MGPVSGSTVTDADRRAAYESFARAAEPRLRRALAGCRGIDGAPDAVAEALAYAWEHWDRVSAMENPLGYLYRVGQSRTRGSRGRDLTARGLALPPPSEVGVPEIEPALVPALLELPETQRTAVWLVHACSWSYAECAEAMDVSVSAVGTHVSRALGALRIRLGALGAQSDTRPSDTRPSGAREEARDA
jgi:DNA-directed RNA polymerase specialized sigma24 family protein